MASDDVERWTIGARRFRQIAVVTVAGLCLLVIAGGVVRLTGSGLGCDDWPNCNDESFVDVSTGHAAIEQLNRLLSGLIGIPTLLLAVGSFRVRPPRPSPERWPRGPDGLIVPSLGVLVTVLANGIVGGIAVRADLHPALVQSHFLLAMASIAFGTLAIRRATTLLARSATAGQREPGSARLRAVGVALWSATAVALATGTVVTGTGPHAGDENVRRWGFDISNVARLHSVTVIVAVLLALGIAALLRNEPAHVARTVRPLLSAWLFVALVQGGIGYLQYLNGVPELLVGAHIACATALWLMTVWLATTIGSMSRTTSGRMGPSVDAGISEPVARAM